MATFRYKALQKDGSVGNGFVDGGSKGEVGRKLAEKGMRVLSLTEEAVEKKEKTKKSRRDNGGEGDSSAPAKKKIVHSPDSRLSSKQLIQFTEELSDMLSAGVQLDGALSSIAKRSASEPIRNVATHAYERVRDGVPLATALQTASASFSELYCNLVSAGEVSGALGDILKRQVKYLTTLADLKGKLATALIYPAFLVVSGIGVSAMFALYLIPKLRTLVESTGGELPPFARFMLASGDFLKANWIAVLGLFALAIILLVVMFQQEKVQEKWDEVKLRIPLFGKLLITRFNVQFVETLSNLLSNGLPLVRAMELVEGTTPNSFIKGKISEITARVSEGAMLHKTMEKAGVFEAGLIDMVRIGEDTGQLSASMSKAGVRLDREFARAIDKIGTVIQPAIILVMSVVVGMMAYMMISIIYETIDILRNRQS